MSLEQALKVFKFLAGWSDDAPAWPKTSLSAHVFLCCWKISSGSILTWACSCAHSAWPRAHSGTGLRGSSSSSSESSQSDLPQHQHS